MIRTFWSFALLGAFVGCRSDQPADIAADASAKRPIIDMHLQGKRIMFGSDQMVWPELIGQAIETIESAPFLTGEQKHDIFYNNAARFLGLPELPAPTTP